MHGTVLYVGLGVIYLVLLFTLAVLSFRKGHWVLGLIGFFFPRIVLIILWFYDYTPRAFQTTLWPVLGFIFMPFTTLAYAYAVNTNGSVTGGYLALVIFAALLDLGTIGGGGRRVKRKVVVVKRES